jgi:EAL domain-containing protein (putative c-di-GMP-specific phosphodiesterase class I)
VSKRFLQVIRPSDTVARMGGDEFTFIIEDIDGLSGAIIIAERILESLAGPFIIESNAIYTSASLGICYGTPQYKCPNEILRDADIAMYRAKQSGKAKIDIFNPEMHDDAILTMQLENDLRQALQSNQLTLHYQPIINLRNENICGFEALLRWKHPQKGFIPPDTFIPIAEDTGQIIEIGNWVIDTACQQIQKWNRAHYSENNFFVSINLSGSQILKGGLASYIRKILETYDLDAGCIHFEVTETLLIAHQQQATQTLQEIRQLGAKLSADDFGKGYSSLTYLQNFEFDVLKIDKEFVNGMSADGKGLQLVKTILKLAKDFSLSVVAEGIETQEQLDSLKQMDCLMAQGYFLCKPRAPEDINGLLENGIYNELDALTTETTR